MGANVLHGLSDRYTSGAAFTMGFGERCSALLASQNEMGECLKVGVFAKLTLLANTSQDIMQMRFKRLEALANSDSGGVVSVMHVGR